MQDAAHMKETLWVIIFLIFKWISFVHLVVITVLTLVAFLQWCFWIENGTTYSDPSFITHIQFVSPLQGTIKKSQDKLICPQNSKSHKWETLVAHSQILRLFTSLTICLSLGWSHIQEFNHLKEFWGTKSAETLWLARCA